jgi:hypothetical protein
MFQAGGAAGERPYAGAVQMVREMARVGSPGEKWQLAEGLQKQLESSVMQFYRKHGIKVEGVEVSPSDLQILLLYLVVQANQPGLLAHLTLAAHFSHSKSPRGAPTVEMLLHCFELLEKGNVSRIKEGKSPFESDLHSDRTLDVRSYFDEVSAF